MKKYLVYLKFNEFGSCEVEADSEAEAIIKARKVEMNGNMHWGDRDEEETYAFAELIK